MLSSTTLHEALAIADAAGTVREAAAALRVHFGTLRVIVVDALDMRGEAPAARSERHALYLGASDGHCWALTSDPAAAAGLFIATAG